MSWQIDNAHSKVGFHVRHMMVSKVRGSFEAFGGEFRFDPDNPADAFVNISIDAKSINTGVADRDGHLRSPDFFNVETYPELTFVSKRVEQTGDGQGRLIGDLTMAGTTREVTLDVTYFGTQINPMSGAMTAGFSATTSISRKEFDLTWNVALESGGWLVGDKITIEIDLQAFKMPVSETA
jgi:polyisoprenoid-binding protein YceI